MRKAILTLFAFIILCTVGCLCVNAADSIKKYQIDELAMTIDIPSEINVVTRGVKQSDDLFQNGTYDYIQTMAEFRENNLYLLGKDDANTFRINVSMTEDNTSKNYKNFQNLNSTEKNSIMQEILNDDAVVACSVYETPDAVYFESLLKYTDSEVYHIKQYYTVVNGQNINISIVSINDELTSDENKLIEKIVNSAEFTIHDGNTGGFSTFATVLVILLCVIVCFGAVYLFVRYLTNNPKTENDAITRLNSDSYTNKLLKKSDSLTEYENAIEENDSDEMMDFFATDKEIEEKKKKDLEETERKKQEEARKQKEELLIKQQEAEKNNTITSENQGNSIQDCKDEPKDNINESDEETLIAEEVFTSDKTNQTDNDSDSYINTAAGENSYVKLNQEDTEFKVDIDIDSDDASEAEDDEDLDPNLFEDENVVFSEENEIFEDSTKDFENIETQSTSVQQSVISKMNSDNSTEDSKNIETSDLQIGVAPEQEEQNVENCESKTEADEYDFDEEDIKSVDIDAAIAYFQDDFDTRKARRETIKNKSKEKKRFKLFGKN